MTLSDDLEFTQRSLTRYLLTIFWILGVVGNLFNLAVFCQKHLRSNACAVYFLSTSGLNFLLLLVGLMPVILASFMSYDPASYSSTYCKFRSYIVHILLMMSRSSVALACLDRFVLCSRHVRIRALGQRTIAIRMLAAACVIWLLIPVHLLVKVDIQMPGRRCGAAGTYSIIYTVYASTVTILPLVMMIVFTTLAIRSLQVARLRVHPSTSSSNNNQVVRIKRRDAQFVVILASEVVIYVVSTCLFPVYLVYIAVTADAVKTSTRTAIEGFMRYIVLSFLIYFNSCSIFYAQLVASKAFRQECKMMLRRLFGRPSNDHGANSTDQMSTTRHRTGQQKQLDSSLRCPQGMRGDD